MKRQLSPPPRLYNIFCILEPRVVVLRILVCRHRVALGLARRLNPLQRSLLPSSSSFLLFTGLLVTSGHGRGNGFSEAPFPHHFLILYIVISTLFPLGSSVLAGFRWLRACGWFPPMLGGFWQVASVSWLSRWFCIESPPESSATRQSRSSLCAHSCSQLLTSLQKPAPNFPDPSEAGTHRHMEATRTAERSL